MWAIFIGFALGVLQVVVLRKTVVFMSADKSNAFLGIFITLGKMALILVTLWLIAKFAGIEAVLWCAGGLAIAMIGLPIIRNIGEMKKSKAQAGQEEE